MTRRHGGTVTTGIPEWTQRAEKRGLDPLSMQTTSIALYQQLMPGIGNVTLRMRYYVLYTWLSLSYARHSGNVSPKAWRGYTLAHNCNYSHILRTSQSSSRTVRVYFACFTKTLTFRWETVLRAYRNARF